MLEPGEVLGGLGLGSSVPVVATSVDGSGVRYGFALAVRACLQRVHVRDVAGRPRSVPLEVDELLTLLTDAPIGAWTAVGRRHRLTARARWCRASCRRPSHLPPIVCRRSQPDRGHAAAPPGRRPRGLARWLGPGPPDPARARSARWSAHRRAPGGTLARGHARRRAHAHRWAGIGRRRAGRHGPRRPRAGRVRGGRPGRGPARRRRHRDRREHAGRGAPPAVSDPGGPERHRQHRRRRRRRWR